MSEKEIEEGNQLLKDKSPNEIVAWALNKSDNSIVTTSFGVYSSAILHAVTSQSKNIPVIWCDTGYNTPKTYEHTKQLTENLGLNLHIYTPKHTRGYIDVTLGMPSVDDPRHEEFTELVKLEPFRRALNEWKPEVWFTNLRKGQNAFRDSKNILSLSNDGILKVSPFFHWSDEELDNYLQEHSLPKNLDYFDPVKALQSRECGIHFQ